MAKQTALWTIMVYISGDGVLDNFAVESLKQLSRGAGNGVTVKVLFDPNQGGGPIRETYDKPGKLNAPVLKGAEGKKASLAKDKQGEILGPLNAVDPKNLKEFIKSVISAAGPHHANCHYGLVLWGHGTALLLDSDQPKNKGAGPRRRYLTLANLREALKGTELPAKKSPKARNRIVGDSSTKLDFIALDACSMSMVEVASELQDYADFMIASQDDVPDQSFPYEQILSRLRSLKQKANAAREACTAIPADYKDSFQNYYPAPGPPVTDVTLSSLNLQSVTNVTVPLGALAVALQQLAFASQDARRAIIQARSASHSFVLGLYVDVYDFCQRLTEEESTLGANVKSICMKICASLEVNNREHDLILNNQTNEEEVRCHGLSVYLPYLTTQDGSGIEQSFTVSGPGIETHLTKNASTANLHKSRAARIAETEEDLASTRFNQETKWLDFIKGTWSYILAKEQPLELDLHYSAQQCLVNLLSLCEPPGKSAERAA